MPNAPMVVVIAVTASIPPIIQLFIRNAGLGNSAISEEKTSPKNSTYSPIIINTASREKNTEDLSLKNSFMFLFAIVIILL